MCLYYIRKVAGAFHSFISTDILLVICIVHFLSTIIFNSLLEKWLFLNNQAKIPSRSFDSYKPYHAKVLQLLELFMAKLKSLL
jgi:hypothetical protein